MPVCMPTRFSDPRCPLPILMSEYVPGHSKRELRWPSNSLLAQSKQLKRDSKFWRPLRSQWRLGDCMRRLGTSTGMRLIRTQPITISSAQHPGSCELRILFHLRNHCARRFSPRLRCNELSKVRPEDHRYKSMAVDS